jgi:cobalamin-dependent methionine synthase I
MQQVSVGRLGIITSLTLGIVPQVPVQRLPKPMPFEALVDEIKAVQDKYNAALAASDGAAVAEALAELDETQVRTTGTHS